MNWKIIQPSGMPQVKPTKKSSVLTSGETVWFKYFKNKATKYKSTIESKDVYNIALLAIVK